MSARDSRAYAQAGGRGDAELLRRFASSRDPILRERIVERFLPLARYAAGRYAQRGEPFDDLQQVACEGLVKAIDRFDPDRGIAFASYAMPTMRGELRRHFRDRSWMVRPPRDLQERTLVVDRAVDELAGRLGRAPTVAEIAGHLDLADEAVLEALQATAGRRAVSFSAPWGRGGLGDDDRVEDGLGTDDEGFAHFERRETLAYLRQVLSRREARVLHLRFHHDMTQAQIGAALGVSQMQVSRVMRGALTKLRRAADHDEHLTRDRMRPAA